jgi:hypothetical protein
MQLASPPGYGPIVLLDREKHGASGIKPDDRRFGNRLQAIYLTTTEFFEAAHFFPLVFAATGGAEQSIPIAVTGLRENQNLFIGADGRWREEVYRPAYVRRYPFCIAETSADDGHDPLVCVDASALDKQQPPLFRSDGKSSEVWLQYEALIREMEAARGATSRLTQTLAELELLEPFEAHVHPSQAEPLRLSGMQRVAENRLRKLSGEQLAELMQQGYLSCIYAHLFSLRNFAELMRLAAKDSD